MTRSTRLPLVPALAALALGLAAPAFAQEAVPNPSPSPELSADRGYDKHTAKHEAVDAQEQPTTQTLNKAVAAVGNDAQEINAANKAQFEMDSAQYEADRAAYRTAVEANARTEMADVAHYDRQQRAYAYAMAAWRIQAQACKDGKTRACKYPTPDPAWYY